MRRNGRFRGWKFALIAIPAVIVFTAVFGFVVMSLWNWLMPLLFGVHLITFWQALGVLVLSRILFGGFHGRRGGMNWRRRMMERSELRDYMQMTPEEREKFREGLRYRCGRFDEKGPESAPSQP
jgi:hypothetical protein